MTQSSVLEFPAMLHGDPEDVRCALNTQGQRWVREFLETGGFTLPRQMLQVAPGELLIVDSGGEPNIIPQPGWRVYMFDDVFMSLNDGVPAEGLKRAEETLEAFCLSTPWGALFNAVSPYPKRSAERMARRLAALLRDWVALQGPRYAFWHTRTYTLEQLVEDIYGMTMRGWCPEGAASVREHLALTVERMAHATREQCVEAVLRVLAALVQFDTHLKHPEELSEPGFLRERLTALLPGDWEDVSSGDRYTVMGQLAAWDRELGQH